MPRCETRWLINEGALTFTRKIFHRAQKFSFISCLLRARISVKELRSQNIEYELRRLSAAVEFQCLSCIFWCWSCETTAVRSAGLYASLISLYIMIYDYSEDLDVIQLSLFCEEFASPPKCLPGTSFCTQLSQSLGSTAVETPTFLRKYE